MAVNSSAMTSTGSHSDVKSHNRPGALFNYGVIKYAHDGRKNVQRIVNCFRDEQGTRTLLMYSIAFEAAP